MEDKNAFKKALTFNELIKLLSDAVEQDGKIGEQPAYINMGNRSFYRSSEVCGLTKCFDGTIAIQGKWYSGKEYF